MTVAAPPGTFDRHTAVEDDWIGRWRAHIEEGLSGIGGGAHGGYLAAIALRAMAKAAGDPTRRVRSLGIQLLSRVEPGTVELAPRIERAGSSISAVSLRIEQHGQAAGHARALFGAPSPALGYSGAAMPDVPPPERCRPLFDKPASEAGVGLLVEHRPAAAPLPFDGHRRAEIIVWMRLVEDRPLDALATAVLADAAPPALFAHLTSFVAMPSIQIDLHFADPIALDCGPWVLGALRTIYAGEGYAIEDGELWTPTGRLVLQARQVRRIRTSVRSKKVSNS